MRHDPCETAQFETDYLLSKARGINPEAGPCSQAAFTEAWKAVARAVGREQQVRTFFAPGGEAINYYPAWDPVQPGPGEEPVYGDLPDEPGSV